MLLLMESNNIQRVKFDWDHIKAIILDVLVTGIYTLVNVLNFVFSKLLRHPKIMVKVEKELLDVVGMDRSVEEYRFEKVN